MQKLFFIAIILLIVIIPIKSNAQQRQTLGNFGGRITTTFIPGVTCGAQYGPIIILPTVTAPVPGPFTIQSTQNIVNPGGQILGKYERILDSTTCQIQTPSGPVPFPTFRIKNNFKTSRF